MVRCRIDYHEPFRHEWSDHPHDLVVTPVDPFIPGISKVPVLITIGASGTYADQKASLVVLAGKEMPSKL
jgi:hypothetical protein